MSNQTTQPPLVESSAVVLPAWEMISADPEMWETRPRDGWKYCIIFDIMQGWVSYLTEGTKYKRCTPLYDEAAVSMDEAKAVCLRHWQNA